jgi:phospholipid-binding lipoprotein MlaA
LRLRPPLARRRAAAPALALLAALLAAPAGVAADPLADEEDADPAAGFPDPFERANRLSFRLNLGLDRWLFDPLTRAYVRVVPAPARRSVRRALANLNAPSVFVNDLLQLEPRDAGVTAVRFVVNTTAGLLGLLDVAARLGLEGHASDFGQTLALLGVPSGPYLLLPVAGPTTLRDGTGYLVDFLFRPTTYFLTPGAQLVFTSIRDGTHGFAAREAHAEGLRALEASSVDYYAALRSAFFQDRTAHVWARRNRRHAAASPSAPGAAVAPRGEVVDPGAHAGEEGSEALPLEH